MDTLLQVVTYVAVHPVMSAGALLALYGLYALVFLSGGNQASGSNTTAGQAK